MGTMRYHIHRCAGGPLLEPGKWWAVEGWAVEIPGFSGLFVHRAVNDQGQPIRGIWHVSEQITGCALADGESKRDAISEARRVLAIKGQARLAVGIATAIERYGRCPDLAIVAQGEDWSGADREVLEWLR
jgi:hypothetical protein